MKLKFIPPEIKEDQSIAKLQKREVHIQTKKWENTIVLFITGAPVKKMVVEIC